MWPVSAVHGNGRVLCSDRYDSPPGKDGGDGGEAGAGAERPEQEGYQQLRGMGAFLVKLCFHVFRILNAATIFLYTDRFAMKKLKQDKIYKFLVLMSQKSLHIFSIYMILILFFYIFKDWI